MDREVNWARCLEGWEEIASGLGGCEGSLGRRCARGSELRGACAGL